MAGQTAVIVDGYSTGNFLPAAFSRLGVDVVHVQTTEELIPSMLPPDLSAYCGQYVAVGPAGFERVVADLRRLRPTGVAAGQETAVPPADRLSACLGLPGNGEELSPARRDKYRMIETLRAAGIRCARQFKSAEPAAITAWAQAGAEYPVVVKPLSSASTDNVFICRDAGEVETAARTVLSARDVFGQANHEALIQSYLCGTEYIVDTVSATGQRYVCGVWQYEKRILPNGRPVYDRDVLMAPDAAPMPELIAYVDTVLDALGIRQGPAHAEVILTPDGPALVEIGARLNGNMHPAFHDLVAGANQADLTALSYARPGQFLECFAGGVYRKLREAAVHNTSTQLSGVVESVDEAVVETIAALPCVYLVSVRLAPGKRIRPTVDLTSSPLRIFMLGSDPEALLADRAVIGELKDQVYRVRAK